MPFPFHPKGCDDMANTQALLVLCVSLHFKRFKRFLREAKKEKYVKQRTYPSSSPCFWLELE